MNVELTHVPHTNSLLMGYEIGSADLPHGRRMIVTAIGNTVRFQIRGIDGYVDLDLGEIAHEAAVLLTARTLAEESLA